MDESTPAGATASLPSAELLTGPGVAELTWRALTREDAAAVHALVERAAAVDDPPERFSPEEMDDELSSPWLDLRLDSRVGHDHEGIARAFAMVDLRPGDVDLLRPAAFGAVDPAWRRRGVGTALLRWQVARGEELTRARRTALAATPPSRLTLLEEDGNEAVGRLALAQGMVPLRYFLVLERSLAEPPAAPEIPPGVDVLDYDADRDANRLLEAHNAAFAHHWGFQPWTAQAWQQWEVGHRDFRPDWTLTAVDSSTGEVVGYATAAGYEHEWEVLGVRRGWTSKLGVLPSHRGRGLGTALLREQLRRFAAAGMQTAGLDVDAENTTGALGLYTAIGYRQVRRNRAWGHWY